MFSTAVKISRTSLLALMLFSTSACASDSTISIDNKDIGQSGAIHITLNPDKFVKEFNGRWKIKYISNFLHIKKEHKRLPISVSSFGMQISIGDGSASLPVYSSGAAGDFGFSFHVSGNGYLLVGLYANHNFYSGGALLTGNARRELTLSRTDPNVGDEGPDGWDQ